MDLGKRFKHYRVKAGLKQREAAQIIGVNDYQIGNYETNRSEPNIEVLKKMSRAYGVSVDDLIGNNRLKNKYEDQFPKDEPIDLEEIAKQLTLLGEQLEKAKK